MDRKTLSAVSFNRLTGLPILSFALATLIAGCTTMNVPEFKVQETKDYKHIAETNGLLVAVQPVTDKTQVKEAFRTDLVAKGLVPILVVVENKSSSSFLLAREKIFVVQADTGTNGGARRKIATSSGGEHA